MHGFEMLSRHKREFIALCCVDHLFPVKFAYLVDRVFQNFVQDLGDFHSKSDPIKRAKKSLKGQQVREIEAAMTGFKTGSLSHLFLPQTLQGGTPAKDAHPSTDGGAKCAGGGRGTKAESQGEEGAKEKTPPEEWWSTNPSPVAAWKTPEGKSFSEIFDHKKDSLKVNTESWPRFKPHNPHRRGRGKTFLCLQHQTKGKHMHTCKAAHVIPEKTPAAERKIMDDKFKKIYN
jgi:hypothetical protein